MSQEQIRKNWELRGYSFGVFKDSPGQVWEDFVHRTNELVILAEGEIEIEMEYKSQQPQISGEFSFLPVVTIQS